LGIGGPPGLRAKGPEERGWVEGACPHLKIIGLMNDAALLGPVVMQRKEEILEVHEQPCEVVKLMSYRPGAREEANRNGWKLSSNNPSMIKELHQNSPVILTFEPDRRMGYRPLLFCPKALDVVSAVLYCPYT
jgi:hypothetical protein